MDKIKGEYESFLNFPEWDANSPYIRREIRTRWSKADLDDDDKREGHLTTLKSEWDAYQYGRNRELEYPTMDELTVALYDTDDKAALETKRAAVKTKWPKDNSGPVE